MKYFISLCIFIAISLTYHAQLAPQFKVSGSKDDLINDHHSPDISLKKYKAQIHILGDIAQVTVLMEFHNHTQDIKEGTLTFPLPEGVSISGYALDINGIMRDAVPVEKVKATAVFESIERRQVDPGIIEKVEGNNFRTRIYPINPKASRTIEIRYQYTLNNFNDNYDLRFMLPETRMGQLDLEVTVLSGISQPKILEQPTGELVFVKNDHMWTASISKQDILLNQPLHISIPYNPSSGFSVMKEKSPQEFYFYGSYPIQKLPAYKSSLPKRIGVIIDNSWSQSKADKSRIKQFLQEYLTYNKNVIITATTLNVVAQKPQTFKIVNGNSPELMQWIDGIIFDGATDLSQIPKMKVDEVLLFSEGLSTFGDVSNEFTVPIHTFNTQHVSNPGLLKFISHMSGGRAYNFLFDNNQNIISNLGSSQTYITKIIAPAAEDIFPLKYDVINDHIIVTGIVKNIHQPIAIHYSNGKDKGEIIINPKDASIVQDCRIDQLWAQRKIDYLEMHYDRHKDEVLKLGQQYGIVTKNTSLMVLELLEDYIKYKIIPPPELRSDYDAFLREQQLDKEDDIESLMFDAMKMMDELEKWWEKDFHKKEKSNLTENSDTISSPRHMILPESIQDTIVTGQPGPTDHIRVRGTGSTSGSNPPLYIVDGEVYSGDISSIDPNDIESVATLNNESAMSLYGSRGANGVVIINTKSATDGYIDTEELGEVHDEVVLEEVVLRVTTKEYTGSANVLKSEQIEKFPVQDVSKPIERGNTYEFVGSSSDITTLEIERSDIDNAEPIKVFNLIESTEYMQTLEGQKTVLDAYNYYLSERQNYIHTPTYYFNVAHYFYTKGHKDYGLKVISNLLEMKMEDPVTLKTVFYILYKNAQYKEANYVAKRIMQFRAMDPQTYRDLALSYLALNEYQQALDLLYDALLQEYTEEALDRDEGIEEILLMEMNNIISLHKKKLDLTNIDPELIEDLPVDLRIVMNWNTDLSDIDLHVTDPNDEICSYINSSTSSGGRISDDFTNGFGPEQFIIKNATKGKYTIQTDAYRLDRTREHVPTTLMIEVYRHYGTSSQTKEVIVFQFEMNEVEDEDDDIRMITIAEIEF